MMRMLRNAHSGFCESFRRCFFLVLASVGGWLCGCNDTCFSITSNSSTGTVSINASNATPTCKFQTANARVRVVIQTIDTPSWASHPIQHIFVTLRGIDIHPGAIADERSPDWLELLPHLSGPATQIDLFGGAKTPNVQWRSSELAAIPAGTYRQLRIRLVPDPPTGEDALPGNSGCGGVLFNCLVPNDGQIQSLQFDHAAALYVPQERIANGTLILPPDSATDVVIWFSLSWFLSSSATNGIHLAPTLSAAASTKR